MNISEIHRNKEKIYQIYDEYRTLLLNKKYYARQLSRFRRYNFWMEMIIIVGAAGSGVAGFAVWQWQWGKIIWALISSASILLAIIKPLLRLTERIEEYGKLYGEYASAFASIKILVDDLQVDRVISIARIAAFDELRTRAADLAKLGDPNPSRAFVRTLQAEVNTEVLIKEFWIPLDEAVRIQQT